MEITKKIQKKYTKITFLLFSKLPKNYSKITLTFLQFSKLQKKIVFFPNHLFGVVRF